MRAACLGKITLTWLAFSPSTLGRLFFRVVSVWRNRDTIHRRTLVALRRIPFNNNRTVPAASIPACGVGAVHQRSPAGTTAARPAGIPGWHRGLVRIIGTTAQKDRTVSCKKKEPTSVTISTGAFQFPPWLILAHKTLNACR